MKRFFLTALAFLLAAFGVAFSVQAVDAPYFGLERTLTSKLTDDDIGRVFLLKLNLTTKEGGRFTKGQKMVLRAVDVNNPFLYFCTPYENSDSREIRIREPQVIRSPFYEGTPATAYSQLILEIFAAPDFFDYSKVRSSVNMKNRREIQNNLDTFLIAAPASQEINFRIEVLQDIIEQENEVVEKLNYNKRKQINQKKADAEAWEQVNKSQKSRSSSSCSSCSGGTSVSCGSLKSFKAIFNGSGSSGRSTSSSSSTRKSKNSLDSDEREDLLTDYLIPHLGVVNSKIDEVISTNDLLLATAIFLHTENFVESVFASYGLNCRNNDDYRDKRKEMLELICLSIKNRLQDNSWQAKCQDFTGLFPKISLVSKGRAPNSSHELRFLFDRAITAYVEIYDYSAIANFDDWGRAALDFSFFVDGTAIGDEIENEFAINLDKYKKAQGTTNNNSGDASQPADNTDNN